MTTALHRLQVSLPAAQVDYLAERSRRDGVSIAEVIRRMVEREASADRSSRGIESVWDIAGIADDTGGLVAAIPVSERVDLYLADAVAPQAPRRPTPRRRPKRR
jgi:Ribbon-helix-helix protein, copG family